jgi:hypothetical protein
MNHGRRAPTRSSLWSSPLLGYDLVAATEPHCADSTHLQTNQPPFQPDACPRCSAPPPRTPPPSIQSLQNYCTFRLRPVAGTQDLASIDPFHPAAAVQTTFLQNILPAATGLQWAAELVLCAPSDPSFLLPSTFPMYSFALSAHIVSFTTPTDPPPFPPLPSSARVRHYACPRTSLRPLLLSFPSFRPSEHSSAQSPHPSRPSQTSLACATHSSYLTAHSIYRSYLPPSIFMFFVVYRFHAFRYRFTFQLSP